MLRIGAAALAGSLEDIGFATDIRKMDALRDDAFYPWKPRSGSQKEGLSSIGQLGVDAFGKKQTYVDPGRANPGAGGRGPRRLRRKFRIWCRR